MAGNGKGLKRKEVRDLSDRNGGFFSKMIRHLFQNQREAIRRGDES